MANRVKLDYAGFTALRRSTPVKELLTEVAEEIADKATALAEPNHSGTPRYVVAPARDSRFGAIALASTGNSSDKQDTANRVDQAHHNTLMKALGA